VLIASCAVFSFSIVPPIFQFIKDGYEIARLVVEEAFDDLLTSDFAEDVQYEANGMRER
jgi:hypothetical protein